MATDFVMTIDSDDEGPPAVEEAPVELNRANGAREDDAGSSDGGEKGDKKAKKKSKKIEKVRIVESVSAPNGKAKGKAKAGGDGEEGGPEMDGLFSFDDGSANVYEDPHKWGIEAALKALKKREGDVPRVTVDDIIERRRKVKPSLRDSVDEADGAKDVLDDGNEEADDLEDEGAESDEDEEDEIDDDAFGAGVVEAEEDSEEEDPLASSEEDAEEEEEAGSVSEGGGEGEGTEQDEESSSESGSDSEEETEEQKARKAAYFAPEAESTASASRASGSSLSPSFQSLSLSRQIMRALSSLSYTTPTPIQARTIPLALAGRDIVANAVTGSGKTAAFLIPVLERLGYRGKGKQEAKSRVIILCPTRELAVQCVEVGRGLARHMDVRFCLCVGGLSLKSQEAELRLRPDIVVATPGRLIDHVRNSPSFTLDDAEILVIDEADRMLEEGFAAELNEIINATPRGRQTMLFSATMTDDVEQLVRLSLQKPIRLFVDPKRSTASRLVQEFVRVRGSKRKGEDDARPALLLSLVSRTFRQKCIIFFRSKALAHQMKIVFGLMGLKAAELHGNLTQEQRLQALSSFRDGAVDFLLATDLASRGLDIKGIETVINYDMPNQFEQYLHRVGRTARAGRNGRSVTLVGEGDRKLLKTALKRSPPEQVKHRIIPPEVVQSIAERLEGLKEDVSEVLKEEKEEKSIRQAEMELKKSENMIEHREEILSRPARTWFQSEKDKQAAKGEKQVSKEEYEAKVVQGKRKTDEDKKPARHPLSGLSRRQKRIKLAREEMEKEKDSLGSLNASIRAAKKDQRPKPVGVPEPRKGSQANLKKGGKGKKKEKERERKKMRSSTNRAGKSAFDVDLGEKRGGKKTTGGPAKSPAGKKGGKAKGKGKGAGKKGR